jgi:ubiquitin C-terminal hydrolase
MIPEIIVVAFNIYQERRQPDAPPVFEMPSSKKGVSLQYQIVAAIDHTGSLSGGHYTAQGLRRSPQGSVQACRFNDASTSVCANNITPTQNTYLVFYHYVGEVRIG